MDRAGGWIDAEIAYGWNSLSLPESGIHLFAIYLLLEDYS